VATRSESGSKPRRKAAPKKTGPKAPAAKAAASQRAEPAAVKRSRRTDVASPAEKPAVKRKTAAATPRKTAGAASRKTAAAKPRARAKKTDAASSAALAEMGESPAVIVPEQEPAPLQLVGPAFPDTAFAVVEKLLTGFLAHEVRKVGVGRAVLGLSGGVDSAVSAAVAVRALGPDNVLGVMMPYQSSSPESLADAREVAASLGIETIVVDITSQIDAYFAASPDASRLRRGNKMARERMTVLYDQSAARQALVIGTTNKTELLLGYGTLYGDMASALNPIGDLYKTQVWGLARHLGLPAAVIEKAPTADLWSGQTDETELGFSYHEVDRLLYRLVDERCSVGELQDMGFDAAFVERISRMVRSSQFKRRLPIIAKISSRSVDTDFRYSRDWGL
jgi:NAD+ synthase